MADRENFPTKISGIVEAAFLVVLAQNAMLLGKPIISLAQGELFFTSHFLIFSIPLINMSAIISNWLTCKIYEKEYNIVMLLEDVITLGVFYLQVYVLLELCKDKIIPCKVIYYIISISYVIIFGLFIIWNISALKHTHNSRKRKNILIANIQNIFSIALCLCIFLTNVFNKRTYTFLFYVLFIIFWFYIWIFHNRRNRTANILLEGGE